MAKGCFLLSFIGGVITIFVALAAEATILFALSSGIVVGNAATLGLGVLRCLLAAPQTEQGTCERF